jgi:hypothetical protein
LATSTASYLLAFAMDVLTAGYRGAVVSNVVISLSTKIISLIRVIYLYCTIGVVEKE